jgi:hypothetical protein
MFPGFEPNKGTAAPAAAGTTDPFYPGLDKIYFDWSIRRGIATVWNDSNDNTPYPSLDAMLDDIGKPSVIVGESTFASFNLDARELFVKRCREDGHLLLTVPTRLTGRLYREMTGLDAEAAKAQSKKRDEDDCKAFRFYALRGGHLRVANIIPDSGRVALREVVNAELMNMRRTLVEKRNSKGNLTYWTEKDQFAEDCIVKWLPNFANAPDYVQRSLGKGDGRKRTYNPNAVFAIGVITKHVSTRKEFDYVSGLYSHAYPSMVRSELMHWTYAGGKFGKAFKRPDNFTLSEFRRGCRWLYYQMKNAITG